MLNIFQDLPIIGLDISDTSIKALLLEKKRILAYSRIALEDGIVSDGKILKKEKLAEKLKQIVRQINVGWAILSLPESRIFVGDFSVIPWRSDEVYTDKVGDLRVSAPKKIVDEYVEACELAGIELVAIDVESLSLWRALVPEIQKPDNDNLMIILDIGTRVTTLSVFTNHGKLIGSITISIAGEHFTIAIQDKLNISREKAGSMKRSIGFKITKAEAGIRPALEAVFTKIINH